MNSKAPDKMFHVDINKAIEQLSNMSKCLDKKWNMHYDKQCDKKCDECEYMYGFGNSGQIENLFENAQEWLEELKFLRQWKADVIESLCKYDCNSIEEVKHNSYNKAIDDLVKYVNELPTVESEDGEIRPMWIEEMAEQLKK